MTTDYLSEGGGARGWLLTTDHKRIGVMFLVAVLVALFFGGVFWKGWGDMVSLVQTLATGTLTILGSGC